MPPHPSRHRLRRGLFALLSLAYRPVKALLKPVVKKHRRLNRFCVSLKEAITELVRPPAPAITLPDWLLAEWKAVHQVEPLLFPAQPVLDTLRIHSVPSSRVARPYLRLCSAIGSNVSHAVLVPWLCEGGADLETLNYIRVLSESDLPGHVVVLSTQNRGSTWHDRLPAGTRFVELGRMFPTLDPEEQEALLVRTLLQLQPPVIHNMNSELAYRVFVKYGRALSQQSRLYTSVFCTDLSPEGQRLGYSHSYLTRCYEYLTAVLCDNRTHLDELAATYALDPRRLHVHYQPAPTVDDAERKQPRPTSDPPTLRVLWAGRLDYQKRPDLLVAIAGKCVDLPITFDVYGASFLTEDLYTDPLRRLPNVSYHGRFDGLPSLPIDRYDVYLYTSQWDGLPNVLLEAMALGLPVVAASVGGIPELIEPGRNGFLVAPFDDVDRYVACLRQALEHPETLLAMAARAREALAARHSWEHFRARVSAVPSYLPTPHASTSGAR